MSEDLGVGGSLLIVPRGPGMPTFALNLTEVHKIEARITEISEANPASLPDLISDFNRAYAILGKMISQIQLELSEAEISLRETKSIILLDKVDKILAEKGLKSTADYRDAVLDSSKEVMEVKRRIGLLEAYIALLTNKAKSMEMAYHGAKKVSEVQANIPNGSPNVGYGRY